MSFEFNGKRFADWLVRPTDRAMFEARPMPAMPSQATGSLAHRVAQVDTPLEVPYADKDQAKALGARWLPDQKRWVVPAGMDRRRSNLGWADGGRRIHKAPRSRRCGVDRLAHPYPAGALKIVALRAWDPALRG